MREVASPCRSRRPTVRVMAAIAMGVLVAATPSCALVGDPSYAFIDVTNDCGQSVRIYVSDDVDPRDEASRYPVMIETAAPGDVLRASSTNKSGTFTIAVYPPSGEASLVRVPFEASKKPIAFSLSGNACPSESE